MKLKIKKLSEYAITPAYATPGSACFDLYATSSGTIPPREAMSFKTDLAFEVPDGWVLKLYSRSGHGFKHGVRLANTTGIIDSDYRGHVPVCLQNDGTSFFHVYLGERIAQGMLERVEQVEFEEVDELSDTARGEGGLGHTGR